MNARLPSWKSSLTFARSISSLSVISASCSVWNGRSHSCCLITRVERGEHVRRPSRAHRRRSPRRACAAGCTCCHQAQAQRLLALDLARRQQQVERIGVTGDARQDPAHAVLGREADARERGRQRRLLGREANVAEQRVHEPEPGRRAVEHAR